MPQSKKFWGTVERGVNVHILHALIGEHVHLCVGMLVSTFLNLDTCIYG